VGSWRLSFLQLSPHGIGPSNCKRCAKPNDDYRCQGTKLRIRLELRRYQSAKVPENTAEPLQFLREVRKANCKDAQPSNPISPPCSHGADSISSCSRPAHTARIPFLHSAGLLARRGFHKRVPRAPLPCRCQTKKSSLPPIPQFSEIRLDRSNQTCDLWMEGRKTTRIGLAELDRTNSQNHQPTRSHALGKGLGED